MLFVAAKYPSTLCYLKGRIEATDRVLNMVSQMDAEGFGNCKYRACEVECPKGISLEHCSYEQRVLKRKLKRIILD
jgi:succinate dehydrogenase / fumarate reductase iron-sulfur subunit